MRRAIAMIGKYVGCVPLVLPYQEKPAGGRLRFDPSLRTAAELTRSAADASTAKVEKPAQKDQREGGRPRTRPRPSRSVEDAGRAGDVDDAADQLRRGDVVAADACGGADDVDALTVANKRDRRAG